MSDAHLRPWIPFMRDEPRSLDGTRAALREWSKAFSRGQAYRYGLWLQREQELLVGEVMWIQRTDESGPRFELGYWVHVDFCRQGFVMEAAQGALELARRHLASAELFACCDVENAPSLTVLDRLGGRPTGREVVEEGDGSKVVLETWRFDAP